MSSDTEGEKTIAAQAAVHSPSGSTAGKDDDGKLLNRTEEGDDGTAEPPVLPYDEDDLIDYTDEEVGGNAALSLDPNNDQANDGIEASEQASTQPNTLGAQNSGGDQTIEKEKIANVAYLASNMLGTDKDLAIPATEWGYTQLAAVMRDAQASFVGLADYSDEDAINSFFRYDTSSCGSVASDYIISRGLLDTPYASGLLEGNQSTGVQYCNWNQHQRDSCENHFVLDTVIPLPKGAAEMFVLISVPELESLRRKVELHENVEKHCKGFKKPLARSLDVSVEDPDSTEAKTCSALLEQTHLARALEVLAELAVNPTRETNKGLLSTYHNLLTVHHDFPTLTGLYAAAPTAAERERELIITELDQIVKLVHDLASENERACRFKEYEEIRKILTDRAKSHLKVSDGSHSARLNAAHMGCRSLDLQADNQALRKKVRDMASTILDFSKSSAEDCNATHQLAEELCVMRNSNAQLSKFHFKQMVNHHEMFDAILANAKKIRRTISKIAKVGRNGNISEYEQNPQEFVSGIVELLGSNLRSISDALTKSEKGNGLAVFDLKQAYRQHMVGEAKPVDFRTKTKEVPEVTKQKDLALRRLHQGNPLTPTAELAALIAQRKHQIVVRNRKEELLKQAIPSLKSIGPLPSQDYAHHFVNEWGQIDCLNSEEIKSLPQQAFDATKSYVPITQTMVLSVKEYHKPIVKKVQGSMVEGKTRTLKFKTGSFAHVTDPQNLSGYLRCHHIPTEILPRTASLLGTEANILRQEFYKDTLLMGDAHGKLNIAIEQLYRHSEEDGLQDKFSILPKDMVQKTFVPDAPSELEEDSDGVPYVAPEDPFNADSLQASRDATQALKDAQASAMSDTNSNCDGDDNGGADASEFGDDTINDDERITLDMVNSDGDDNNKSPAIENAIATSTVTRPKKQRHSGGIPLTRLPVMRNNIDFLRPQFQNLLWPKDWKLYDCGVFAEATAPQWPEGSKDFFQMYSDSVPALEDMVMKLLDIASKPQQYQTWHNNPPKHNYSQSLHQSNGKDSKGKGKGKGKGKKGKGEKGKGRGKGKGKITSSPSSTPVKTSLFERPLEKPDVWGCDKATTEALSQEANQKLDGHYVWSDTAPGTPLAAPFFKAIRAAHKKDQALFSALLAPDDPRLELKVLASKIKGKLVIGKNKKLVNDLLIAFPTKERLVPHLDSNHSYAVSDGTKNKKGVKLTEEIVLSHRYNTVSQRVEFWPGSYYPYQKGYSRSSILGAKKEIYALTANYASHSFAQKQTKGGKETSQGFDPASFKYSDDLKKGEPVNTTEVLLLFIAKFAQYFVPIEQEPFNILWKLEDVVPEPLSHKRSEVETLLKSLQELRQLAPTHFHFDIYSLQYEIIRVRLAKCTESFASVSKNKKRKQRDAKPQEGAKWPSTSKSSEKRQKVAKPPTEASKAVTFGDSPAPATPAPARQWKPMLGSGEHMLAQPDAAITLDFQLAQAKLMVQRIQHQQAVASQQQNEAAPPSSASIPSTPNNEQGGDDTVVETGQK